MKGQCPSPTLTGERGGWLPGTHRSHLVGDAQGRRQLLVDKAEDEGALVARLHRAEVGRGVVVRGDLGGHRNVQSRHRQRARIVGQVGQSHVARQRRCLLLMLLLAVVFGRRRRTRFRELRHRMQGGKEALLQVGVAVPLRHVQQLPVLFKELAGCARVWTVKNELKRS